MDPDSDELEARPDLGRMGRWTPGVPDQERRAGWKDEGARENRDPGTDSDEKHLSLKFSSPEVPFF